MSGVEAVKAALKLSPEQVRTTRAWASKGYGPAIQQLVVLAFCQNLLAQKKDVEYVEKHLPPVLDHVNLKVIYG